MEDSKMTCLDILLAIILPPLVAYRKFGCKVLLPSPDFLFLISYYSNFYFYFLLWTFSNQIH